MTPAERAAHQIAADAILKVTADRGSWRVPEQFLDAVFDALQRGRRHVRGRRGRLVSPAAWWRTHRDAALAARQARRAAAAVVAEAEHITRQAAQTGPHP